jgi:hypothetical protein
MTPGEIARLLIFALAGFALGGASYAMLKLNTVLYLGGDWRRSAVLHLFRLAILVTILVWAARQGGGPLLAMAAGLVAARPVVVPILARLK